MFRAQHPNSWWWTPQTDFLSLILQALQGANWQRSGSKGAAPRRVERPDDRPPRVKSADELQSRRAAQAQALKRRRAQRPKENLA